MLKDCTECSHKISSKALSCPSCGHPNIDLKVRTKALFTKSLDKLDDMELANKAKTLQGQSKLYAKKLKDKAVENLDNAVLEHEHRKTQVDPNNKTNIFWRIDRLPVILVTILISTILFYATLGRDSPPLPISIPYFLSSIAGAVGGIGGLIGIGCLIAAKLFRLKNWKYAGFLIGCYVLHPMAMIGFMS